MNSLLIIISALLINLVENINCQAEAQKQSPGQPTPPPPPPPTSPPTSPPFNCPPKCFGTLQICAIDCVNGCFKTYGNQCLLDGYNRCKNPFEPAHTFYAKGPCDPRLPECEYCNRNPKCVYDLGLNCFKTILDDCVMHLHNCQNPKSKWIEVFLGPCPTPMCNSCPDDCTEVCY